jgi:hypothetical protein
MKGSCKTHANDDDDTTDESLLHAKASWAMIATAATHVRLLLRRLLLVGWTATQSERDVVLFRVVRARIYPAHFSVSTKGVARLSQPAIAEVLR